MVVAMVMALVGYTFVQFHVHMNCYEAKAHIDCKRVTYIMHAKITPFSSLGS